jgi:hypothetical protein
VQAISVAEVADELYALTPAEFTAARDDRARQARAGGEREAAAEIKKLTRPTASAWAVNQLVRAAPPELTRLYSVAEALGEAQRTLAGERLRELAADRRSVISDLLPVAGQLADGAGQPMSAAALAEVRSTLEAALADAGARDAMRTGRLTRALTYAGLGEVDLTAALAVPGQRAVRPAKGSRAEQPASDAAAGTEAQEGEDHAARGGGQPGARRALRQAELSAAEATKAAQSAERLVTSLGEQRQFLRRRIEHLQREMDQVEAEDAKLVREAKQAQRDRDAARRTLQTAEKRLAKAQQAAEAAESS